MKPPSYEESVAAIRARGVDIARAIMSDRGMVFREAPTLAAVRQLWENDVERYLAEQDIKASAACLMQAHRYLDAAGTDPYCQILNKSGLDSFYDDHDTESALHTLQLSAALNPANEEAIKGVLDVCLHGEPIRPDVALPYMVALARINPKRDETAYVLKLLERSR